MEELLVNGFDLSTMCRLCLTKGVAEFNIFDCTTELMDPVADVIMKCAPVQITRCDEMPNFICQSCNTQLEKSHQFQKQIVQSDQTLRLYLQQLRTSNKQITVECSNQGPSEDSLIHNTSTDIKIKCESLEFQDVSDFNVNLKEEVPSNYTSVYKLNEEVCLKSEIKEEPIDDYSSIPTEGTDNLIDTLSAGDDDTKKELKNSKKEGRSDNLPRRLPSDLKESLAKRADETKNTVEKQYECETCNKSFNKSDTLKKHKRVHTGEKPYRCDACNKCFKESGHLKRHQRVHTGEKPYQCDVCNMCFSSLSNMYSHKRTHAGEKPYRCNICSKCFSKPGKLKIHERVHTGEKPYQCDVCNKCFSKSEILRSHQRVHTGEKPYQCDVCNKCFSISSTLRKHERLHTGEKPYQCNVCKKCFRESGTLKRHQRVHTGVKPY